MSPWLYGCGQAFQAEGELAPNRKLLIPFFAHWASSEQWRGRAKAAGLLPASVPLVRLMAPFWKQNCGCRSGQSGSTGSRPCSLAGLLSRSPWRGGGAAATAIQLVTMTPPPSPVQFRLQAARQALGTLGRQPTEAAWHRKGHLCSCCPGCPWVAGGGVSTRGPRHIVAV